MRFVADTATLEQIFIPVLNWWSQETLVSTDLINGGQLRLFTWFIHIFTLSFVCQLFTVN
jgi:hypothetical protein